MGKLNSLVLADGTSEDDALLGITGGALDQPFRIANALGCDEDAFGVHSRQDVAKAFAFLADEVGRRNPHIV
jgi:hypothetical protein